jgi:hypothetical protein
VLTAQDLIDLEIADSVGDLGPGRAITKAVEELRGHRALLRRIRDDLPMIGADPEVALAVRREIDRALGEGEVTA